MPIEAQEAVVIANLCRRWNYNPEQALQAPVWILQMDAVLQELEKDNG